MNNDVTIIEAILIILSYVIILVGWVSLAMYLLNKSDHKREKEINRKMEAANKAAKEFLKRVKWFSTELHVLDVCVSDPVFGLANYFNIFDEWIVPESLECPLSKIMIPMVSS